MIHTKSVSIFREVGRDKSQNRQIKVQCSKVKYESSDISIPSGSTCLFAWDPMKKKETFKESWWESKSTLDVNRDREIPEPRKNVRRNVSDIFHQGTVSYLTKKSLVFDVVRMSSALSGASDTGLVSSNLQNDFPMVWVLFTTQVFFNCLLFFRHSFHERKSGGDLQHEQIDFSFLLRGIFEKLFRMVAKLYLCWEGSLWHKGSLKILLL